MDEGRGKRELRKVLKGLFVVDVEDKVVPSCWG